MESFYQIYITDQIISTSEIFDSLVGTKCFGVIGTAVGHRMVMGNAPELPQGAHGPR